MPPDLLPPEPPRGPAPAVSGWVWPHGDADTVGFQGLPAFRAQVLALLQAAGLGRCDLVLCDADYEAWPLGEAAVVDAFNAWALAARSTHAVILAAQFDAWPRRHPRWVRWRTPWAHRMRCLQAPDDLAGDLPRILLLPGRAGLEVLDAAQWRGVVTCEPVRLARLKEQTDAISQRSGDAFPPTLLGL
ncbi:MAG: hypothetical protein MK041_01400 [Aquabacterium sp.]|nr:hypothetical protein [Aquabacterium sp.]